MPQNLVSLDISADDLAAMDQAIATLETLTKPFITLSADDKSGLVKMGDKSVAFCQQTALVLAQNKEILPPTFDYEEMGTTSPPMPPSSPACCASGRCWPRWTTPRPPSAAT
jgi:hypothetical protein